ncbi:DUF853 family protein [Legionella israelensis]|uniref:helicase HerA-like domain-containing protein n=1 Tax=Legionella israelensis TaxID=454 RepID=UPI00117C1EA9|nr:helicase HerA-like domain-containing protein [Legionella israelensis]QDP71525.1 DUF853 family protein [Legionella israelensis]
MYEDLRLAYKANHLPVIQLGSILLNGHVLPESPVNLVLKSFNRHGLIAGSTGSGKTKTMQVLAEQLSLSGVPSLVMDIKGDVSGLAVPGEDSEVLRSRNQSLNLDYVPRSFPVELLTLEEDKPGVPVRATVQDFGAMIFSRMLNLNSTQTGVMTVLFEYAKDEHIELIDLNDIKNLLQFLQSEEGEAAIEKQYGHISSSSIGTILRQLIELESQGGDSFFGEPAFDVLDLIKTTSQGTGVISILRLMDMQRYPGLFSTFMLKLLNDVYHKFPEIGDTEKPKLVIFIDEAHLIFHHASKTLMSTLEIMVKLIRSKGVGLIFCTQIPNDIPETVLSQLGLKIQHSLRAFTAKDRKAMRLIAQNFPPSSYYQTEHLLTSLGIGEALVTALDAKGQPTPLVHCLIRAPESRMGLLTTEEIQQQVERSELSSRYARKNNPRSANKRFGQSSVEKASSPKTTSESKSPTMIDRLSKNTLFRQVIRQIFRDLTRAVLSVLGIKKKRKK